MLYSHKGILLDAYGVFWGGKEHGLLEGAKEVMEDLIQRGHIVGILSNTTALVAGEKKKWKENGIHEEKHYHFLLTSGEVFRSHLLQKKFPYQKIWVWMGDHPHYQSYKQLFEGTDYKLCMNIEEADCIYLNVPHLNGQDIREIERFIPQVKEMATRKLPLLCANPDYFVHEGVHPVVRQGAVAALYEKEGGQVFYVGKPHSAAYAFAREEFEKKGIVEMRQVVMVGDTPETDIRGARKAGMSTVLVTRTGIFASRGQTVNQLPPEDRPDFSMERLCLQCIQA